MISLVTQRKGVGPQVLQKGAAGGDPYSDQSRHCIELAVHYFVTARSAYFCHYMQVSALNFHHAFEMLLKARLLAKFSSDDLDKDFKHKLPKLWRECEDVVDVDNLAKFDAIIDRLHSWEKLRYPYFSSGAYMTADLRKGLPRPEAKGPASKKVPSYYLVIEDLDELFKELLHAYPLSAQWVRMDMHEGLAAYERDNLHCI